jgi:hypothetical protein
MSHSLLIAKLRIALVAPVLALLAPLGAQTTWVVPTSAPTVQAAVQAAAPGDVVTMAPGHYDTFGQIVINKALTLRSCRIGNPVSLPGTGPFGNLITVTGIAGGSRILLQDIQLYHPGGDGLNMGSSGIGVVVQFSAASSGQIILDRVSYVPGGITYPKSGLVVNALAAVRLVARNCGFTGSSGYYYLLGQSERGPAGGCGAILGSAGRYWFEDCSFQGGRGGDAYWDSMNWLPAQNGAAGLQLAPVPANAQLDVALVRCNVIEGCGGDSRGTAAFPPPSPCAVAAPPGHSDLARCDLYGVTYQAGIPGFVSGCTNTYPTPPPQILGAPMDLDVTPSECSAGQQFTMRVAAQPGDLSGLYLGFPMRRSLLPGAVGPLWMDAVAFGTVVPPPDASGWSTYTLPPVPAGLPSAIDICVQPVHVGPGFSVGFGAPRMITAR